MVYELPIYNAKHVLMTLADAMLMSRFRFFTFQTRRIGNAKVTRMKKLEQTLECSMR